MEQDELQNIEEDNTNQTKKSSQDTNRIMGMAAIFISILSMIAVIYQSYLAREENNLIRIQQSATVLPYLANWYSNVGKEYKIVIENKGVGPAFIKDAKFIGVDLKSKDSLTFKNSNSLCDFMNQQSTFFDSLPQIRNPIQPNMLLSPNERKEIFIYSFDNRKQKSRFIKEFDKYYAGLKITYEDVYGSAWILDSEKGYPIKLKKK